MIGDKCVVLELVSRRGKKKFKALLQKRIFVPLRGSFPNFRRAMPVLFYMGVPSPGTQLFYLSPDTALYIIK